REAAEETVRHLNKYLMLFRGTTMERLGQSQCLGLLGEEAAGLVAGGAGTLPETVNGTTALEGGYLIRTNSTAAGLTRFELWLPEGADEALQALIARLHPANEADWLASEIAAGVPGLAPETREAWVPQMLNWQHLEGIHFKKGCYTGQEVIARMHFLGQLKKSLYRLEAPGNEVPAPGSAVHAGDRAVGEVVRAVAMDDDRVELLAVLRHDNAEAPLHLADGGQPLTLLPLPYRVPEREAGEAPSDT
ncbi:MAG: YgfZ/GcvT domain-containing protein, partial [Marinobacter sp.]